MTAYAPALSTANAALTLVGPGRTRHWIVGGTLAIAATVTALVLLFRPWPARDSFLYSDIAPVRDGIWTAIFIDALAFSACLGLAVLDRRSGAVAPWRGRPVRAR